MLMCLIVGGVLVYTNSSSDIIFLSRSLTSRSHLHVASLPVRPYGPLVHSLNPWGRPVVTACEVVCGVVCYAFAVVGYPSLASVVNAMMAQLTSARVQADSAVADIALMYRDDPLLRPFPVSRVVIDTAVVSLQVRC
jgi:hypothetical protein